MSWIFSASTDLMSRQHTSRIVEPLLRWLDPAISQETIDLVHFFTRKLGHVTEFAILAILLWRAVDWHSPPGSGRDWRRIVSAFLLSILYAATDEFHQLFVPSRGASVGDVCIDGFGAILGLLIIVVISGRNTNGSLSSNSH